jgi:osmotically-inducible protein OsmY
MRRLEAVLFGVANAAAAAACVGPATPPPLPLAPTRAEPAALPAVEHGAAADATIVQVLTRELHNDPATAQAGIGADSAKGIVTLRGSVPARLAKDRAIAIARVVRGIRAIIDRIDVTPEPRPDYELESMVARELSGDTAVRGEHIQVRARSGVVHLSGDVESEAARRLATSDALGVPGVLDVVDDLVATPPTHPNDPRLAAQAERILREDPWLDGSHVTVEANHGDVRLGGWVGSAAERARAEADVRTASPRALDAAALRIDEGINDGTLRDHPARDVGDDQLAKALSDAYVSDPRVHPFVPVIDVREGVIVLTGLAPNADAARAAAEDAMNLPGAASVHDALKTLPAEAPPAGGDASVQSAIRSALEQDPILGPRHIVAYVVGGRVYLRGKVAAEADRVRAVAIATSFPGARDADVSLEVESELRRP